MAKILVIDDEPVVRSYIRTVLERKGHTVDEAESGDAGLQLARDGEHDLALVDLVMPRKDGVQTIEELHDAHKDLGIIVMTGAPPVRWPLRQLYDQPGAMHMLVKPMSEQMLVDTVHEALKARQQLAADR
jgi:DNA-binding NtrC family response regulator